VIDTDRIVNSEGLSASPADTCTARVVAAVDEAIAEALSCGNSGEAMERVGALGFTKTADRLRLARARGQLISVRTRAGLAVAREAGKTGGRPPKLTERQVEMARRMHASGEHTITAIAEILGVTRPTVYRALGRDEPTDPRDRAAAR
jgi:hypothetical protein